MSRDAADTSVRATIAAHEFSKCPGWTRRLDCDYAALLFFFGLLMRLYPDFEKLDSLFRTAGAGNFEFLTSLLVVRDEKLLQLVEQRLVHRIYGRQVLVIVRMNRDAQ